MILIFYPKDMTAGCTDKACVFGEPEGGKVVRKGVYAKMARGEMVRFIAGVRAERPEQIKEFNWSGYCFDEDRSSETEYVFIRKAMPGKEGTAESGLVFMDPDNGLLEKDSASEAGAEKYVLPCEVEQYYNAGHNVVYYCHKGRRKTGQWQDYLSVMFDRIPSAKPSILTYHKDQYGYR